MPTRDETAGQDPHAIRVEQLHRRFGDVHALRGLDFTVAPSTTVGFIGNNGAGKTTTLHTLLGFIPRHQGAVHVLGLDPATQARNIRAQVGFFAEHDAPYDWMRLRVLFSLGAAAYPEWDAGWCAELCRRFELDTRKRIKELSKGMVAKAKLIFAIAHRPRCLILDEPTAGLDPASRQELLDTIGDLTERDGMTTLFSSHQLEDIEGIATHMVLIHQGRTLLSAPIEDLRRRFALIEIPDSEQSLTPAPASAVIHATTHADAVWWLVRDRSDAALRSALAAIPPERITVHDVSVRTVFLFLTGGRIELPNRAGRTTDASGRHC